jgi:hypothetical protein
VSIRQVGRLHGAGPGNVGAVQRRRGPAVAPPQSNRPSTRRTVTIGLVMALAVATLSVVGSTSVVPHASSAGAAAACQSDNASGCKATLPCATTVCPTVDVGPVTGIADGQYVFVKAMNFPSGYSMRIAVCSTTSPVTDPACLNGPWESNVWAPVSVPITVNAGKSNFTQDAYPAFFDQAGQGNNPLPAHFVTGGVAPSFYCDNSSNPCAVEVTMEQGVGLSVGNGPPDSASNTVVLPLSFSAQAAGCPASDPVLNTDSSFSLEHFLPSAVDSTCTGTNGVVALNTATDSKTVVSDFSSGGANLGFVDNPGDANQEATLFGGRQFAYIPIALSGTVVSMLAGESSGGVEFPISSYNLTPNMVAGIITSAYQSPEGTTIGFPGKIILADNLIPALTNATPPVPCSNLRGCPSKNASKQVTNELKYNAFSLLNPVGRGVIGTTVIGSFMSNVANGASYHATDWICNAPNTPYSVRIGEIAPPVGQTNPVAVTVTDTNVGSKTLATAPVGSSIWPPYPGAPWVFPACQPYSTFPALAASGSNYSESQAPAFQAKAMRNWAYGGGSLPQFQNYNLPEAAFGVMDSSDASFYGLNTANLQNAGGQFIAPTPDSLDAAASNLTPCPSGSISCPVGTYQIDYNVPAGTTAYPMPDITYAVVPTSPQPATTATAIKNLLTNLVNYSHSGGKIALPSGYAPLPANLYQAALADIAKDVVAEPATATTTTAPSRSSGTPSGSSGPNGSSGTGPYGSGTGGSSGNGYSGSSLPLSSPGSASKGANPGGTSGGGTGSALTFAGISLVSLDGASRYLLPVIVALALACLIAGPLLLFGPGIRRRRRGVEGAA